MHVILFELPHVSWVFLHYAPWYVWLGVDHIRRYSNFANTCHIYLDFYVGTRGTMNTKSKSNGGKVGTCSKFEADE